MSVSYPPNVLLNVSHRLTEQAALRPDALAIAAPVGTDSSGKTRYQQVTFAELEADVAHLARGLVELGVQPGMRLALLVRPSIEFIALVFALLRSGAVAILIDPGMGRKNLIACLQAAMPRGFVAISPVQAVRSLLRWKFPDAKLNVTIGRRWFWGGETLASLRRLGAASAAKLPQTQADDPAAIIFTTGSTGPPKGVLYTQRVFDTQVTEIRDRFQIQPGEIDLPGFPLFGLFNAAMGVTTIIPEMDPTRPAQVDPQKIIAAAERWQITQSFGSPAIWNRIGRYCEEHNERLSTLKRVLSAGAPVPAHVLSRMKACLPSDAEIHTPYGATEALPIASISATEVLSETQAQTERGAGVCVGTKFPGIEWRVIRINDYEIDTIDQTEELPPREIGELIVTGPQVTKEYVTRTEWNALAKISDGDRIWHRMGDAGYLDGQGRFWFCGRVAHRVQTSTRTMYTIPCEAIFNTHPAVFRSALVGVGPAGNQTPVLVVEFEQQASKGADFDLSSSSSQIGEQLLTELRELGATHSITRNIGQFLPHPGMPVDIRHNAKIFREKLAVWATQQLSSPVDSD